MVYIGLGSNIRQPYQQIKKAIIALNALPETMVIRDSGYFVSKPMGPKDQPDFINAVVELATSVKAMKLLRHCQQIELQHGRVKLRHWGERSIDLDLLLYADHQIKTQDLTVPHPGIVLRDFVYKPLLKLNPDVTIPGVGLLNDIVKSIDKQKQKNVQKSDFNCQFAGNIE